MTVFKRELCSGAKAFLLWSAVIGGLMVVCVGLYPSMKGSMGDMTELFAGMGEFSLMCLHLCNLWRGSLVGSECSCLLSSMTPRKRM